MTKLDLLKEVIAGIFFSLFLFSMVFCAGVSDGIDESIIELSHR